MNRNRMLIGAVVAILLGLLASRYVYVQLRRAALAAAPVKLGQVVVAAAPLQLGTRLQPQYLRLVDWPENSRPDGTCSRIEDCSGRALITHVVENEPILENKLAPVEAGAGLPAVIPEGMRAISIRVDDVIAVAGFVMPGTMVDVLVTGDPQGRGGTNTMTRTFLEDVRVLAAGQRVQQDKDGKPQTESVVTLLVTPEQADRLALASSEGKIQLALRNTLDTKENNPSPVSRASLFTGPQAPSAPPVRPAARKAAPPRRPPPPPDFVVEVIRGNKKETQSFPNGDTDSDQKE